MESAKKNIRGAIEDYLRANPTGVDVTAFVLDRIGKEDFNKYDVVVPKKTFDQAKQDLGKLVKELLDEVYVDVEHLDNGPVDAARWPQLALWVSSYTRHRVDPTRRRF